MSQNDPAVVKGLIIDDEVLLTLEEICHACSVEATYIVELVEEGVLEPRRHGELADQWRFPGTSLRRARMALRLQRDLQVNLAGVALTLELLEEIESLRSGLPER
ncbi:MAG: chaperone modulator CbpM [Gammaproteobacteria bacterium]|jgi:chaperone modulatory protein CbpM|nr:chaperone modulator CbpM [Gammaproteobacteria bacterium]